MYKINNKWRRQKKKKVVKWFVKPKPLNNYFPPFVSKLCVDLSITTSASTLLNVLNINLESKYVMFLEMKFYGVDNNIEETESFQKSFFLSLREEERIREILWNERNLLRRKMWFCEWRRIVTRYFCTKSVQSKRSSHLKVNTNCSSRFLDEKPKTFKAITCE